MLIFDVNELKYCSLVRKLLRSVFSIGDLDFVLKQNMKKVEYDQNVFDCSSSIKSIL